MVVEKRKYNRMDLEDISAKLYKTSDGLEIDFCPINVSKKGISIFVSSALSVGEKVILGLDVGDVDVAVTFAGVTIHSGDFIACDNNGIVVSPIALDV